MAKTTEITLRRPDDWHLHLRDELILETVVAFTARRFARAIVMPNLSPPITTAAQASAYRDRILAACLEGVDFTPLMTCYLTDDADTEEIVRGHSEGIFTAVKLYPAGATTNSANGVTDMGAVLGVLEGMEKAGIPLLVHGETTDPSVDIFYRETVFIDRTLAPLIERFPGLKVVFEHITTSDAVDFVTAAGPNVAATITAHHLMINRNAMFEGGLRPHMYCLPVAKRDNHRLALRAAATSGNAKFFLGTDSAPHTLAAKETACGCAGIFSAPAALEHYVQVFDEDGALDAFETFASLNGPAFYGLEPNEAMITLKKTTGEVPGDIVIANTEGAEGAIKPFLAGETLAWTLVE
ncbi:MAG: dihydroorotase [Alphaproteobacteria bacterium]|jgi:dihydroorotase|nr:dihydroorotase [Alphaproteobacteria bacterium]MBT7943362.1 dihydroorotase [Alphaproteobacteria bacterium]